jgi:hypothetical protein
MSERKSTSRYEAARRLRMYSALGLSLIAGSNAYQAITSTGIYSGLAQQQGPKVELKSTGPTKKQIAKDAAKNMDTIQRLTHEDLGKYGSLALFDKASNIQLAIMNTGADLHKSDREIFEQLIPESTQNTFAKNGIHFTFISPDQAKDDCFNALAHLNKDGSEVVYATVPLGDTITSSPSSTLYPDSV